MKLKFKAIKNQGIFQKIGAGLLFSLLLFVLIYQLTFFDWAKAEALNLYNPEFLLLAIALIGANWYFEWLKWKVGMKEIHNFSNRVLIKGFYAGMISGFITPSALGNFLGRMTSVNSEWKPRVVAMTLMGNGAQFLISLLFGLFSCLLLVHLPIKLNSIALFALSLLMIIGFVIYFTIGKVKVFQKIFTRYIPSLASVSLRLRLHFFMLSMFRYLVFSSQFYFVVLAFQPDLPIETLFWIWQLYLWTTLSPSLFVGKLFIRETMAIFILAHGGVELPIALFASILIWLMNNALPSLFAYFKWKQNVLVEA